MKKFLMSIRWKSLDGKWNLHEVKADVFVVILIGAIITIALSIN